MAAVNCEIPPEDRKALYEKIERALEESEIYPAHLPITRLIEVCWNFAAGYKAALREYGKHLYYCNTKNSKPGECDCGLKELLGKSTEGQGS